MTSLQWRLAYAAISLVALAALSGAIWVLGPIVPALAGWAPRAVLILALLVVWLAVNLLVALGRRRHEHALDTGIAASVTEQSEEAAAVGAKLTAALALMKRGHGRRGYLFEQPWYAIIGPPGTGKTTALMNAGLDFPLAGQLGQGALGGVGGTRLCDWWFTDQAVLIDTAGRYTTQDSNAAVDRAGWDAFLDLLRRTRHRQPLNGVIVAFALSDIAAAPEAERRLHAAAIRQRLHELDQRLGVRIPVYVWFTKADLIAGFGEFFDDLDRAGRDQPWGVTFPLDTANAAAGFGPAYDQLLARLEQCLFARLQQETRPERRALIVGFPVQMATLREPVCRFLAEAFGPPDAAWLRGAYFASGTQEGTPIDRLLGGMARSFGIDQRRQASQAGERGRSYFLTRLLAGVIFNEAMLVSEPPAWLRRRRLQRIAMLAGLAAAVVVGAGTVVAARFQAAGQISRTATALDSYTHAADGQYPDPVSDADLPRLVPLLNAARDLDHAPGTGGAALGLGQSAKLRAGAAAVYRHALGHALLPRLIWRLEAQMRGNLAQPDFMYEATRVYLMLGGQGRLDRALVREWMAVDWRASYPGAFNAPTLADLRTHLDTLLAQPLPAVKLDGGLVAQARATFGSVSLAARVYSRLRPSMAASRLPVWRPSEAMGPLGTTLFVRASGKPLDDGVPGFFTPDGFRSVLLPGLAGAARDVAAESWVMGSTMDTNPDGPHLAALEHDVVQLYEADYAQTWDVMLQDLQVVPMRSLPQAAQDLSILAAPETPLRPLLDSVARQLTLAAVSDAAATADAEPAADAQQQARLSALLAGSQGIAGPATDTQPAGHEIDDRYRALRQLMQPDGGAGLSRALRPLNDLQQLMAKMAAAPIGAAPPAIALGDDPATAVRAQAQAQPEPLARWLLAMADQATVLRGGGGRQLLAAAYNGAGGPAAACPDTVNGRFPFVVDANLETPIAGFAHLLAPGGLIDGFVNTQLQPYLDTSGPVWQPRAANGVAAPFGPADAAQFQRAAQLRDLFFAAGSTTPTLRFDLTPLQLDAGAQSVSLAFDETTVAYSHGPRSATQITWPGPTRTQNVRLLFDPPPSFGTGVLAETGPWALFRLFNHGVLAKGEAAGDYTLSFRLGERTASFLIHASGLTDPFAPDLLQGFHCPILQ